MLGLKYVASAIPGKLLKRKPTVTEEELKSKQKKYEENRKTRKFNEKWKQTYDWLIYDSDKNIMQCSVCLNHNGQGSKFTNLKGQNKFLEGCCNFKLSTIVDHETSAVHQYAVSAVTAKSAVAKSGNLRATEAGKAYLALKEAERTRLSYLFRNTHATMKNNRPLTDFTWLCHLNMAKYT